jgi:leucyl aminopeptidase
MSYFAKSSTKALPIIPLTKDNLSSWCKTQKKEIQHWISETAFEALPGKICLIPSLSGRLKKILVGVSSSTNMWDCGNLSQDLPKGIYKFQHSNPKDAEKWALGWVLGSYQFDQYQKSKSTRKAKIFLPKSSSFEPIVEAIFLTRDLINTPAEDMGPLHLANAARVLARKHKAKINITIGNNLLKKNYPAIYAVGRAVKTANQIPRLIDFKWGQRNHPKLTLVGKGVCFDTGGLDIKTTGGMQLMKKDMGGAANVLGLAHMIMSAKLPVQLRVLIPAVENNIAGDALRPLDIITSRSGKTIEIANTDAEGRVILADALTEACSDSPALIIDFATLTGAARVALGTELPALFTNSDQFSKIIIESGITEQDPLWRLPLWDGYQDKIQGASADLTNAPEGGYGGAITAALFLQEFVEPKTNWAHIDLMAWNLTAKPGRPRGGEAMGIRSIFNALQNNSITKTRSDIFASKYSHD